ncbi:uncharacterized protein EV420DRAFT_1634342 [Desarmillaria tabescens]|uniref:Uncharacterized protein n=1 Tax=Armillaria tabescens TaxID=1929756 RepID=A0AA39NQE2_ARMTA|nr:uncharacterized protein EV420DRAFT_1634342 [Desarmillaria tabescens]KAK0469942.1 hypothetical protein EV420DRAFT_1634342 [Desarmillaria tabescens]
MEHYRSRAAISHELVVVYILSGDDEQVKAGKIDSRVMVIEPFNQGERSESATKNTERSVRDQEVKGYGTSDADLVSFGADLKDTGRNLDKYDLVQKLDIPP